MNGQQREGVLLGSVCFRLAWVGQSRDGPGWAGVVVSSYYGYLGASFLSTIIFLISVNVSVRVCVRLLCVSLSLCVLLLLLLGVQYLLATDCATILSFRNSLTLLPFAAFLFLFFRHFCSLSR